MMNLSTGARSGLIHLQQQCSRKGVAASTTAALRLLDSCESICRQQGKQPVLAIQVRSSSGWSQSRRTYVAPSLRHRRPLVNGQAVAFHMSDLVSDKSSTSNGSGSNKKSESKQRRYDSDLVVVLDMDECIIHSQFFSNPSGANVYAHQVARAKQRNGQNDDVDEQLQEVDSFRFSLPDGDIVHVNKRPYLEEFLTAVTDKYETHIFTAAMEVYASPLLDILDPDGTKFAKRWYRESCTFDSKSRAFVKNLNALPFDQQKQQEGPSYINRRQQQQDLSRVVLVDNNPLSFLANPSNGILVSSFFNDPRDNTLPAVVELLDELNPMADVRPALDARFGLKDALAEIRGGATMNERSVGNDNYEEAEAAVAF